MDKVIKEYEEAPSGSVTFYNYKEPLMKFEAPSWTGDLGHGFVGTLLYDSTTNKMQCHLCGEWVACLQSHVKKEHGINPNYYKQLVGLGKRTALIGENTRTILIEIGKNSNNLKIGRKHTEEEKEKIRKSLIARGKTAEHKNERGTCPVQLLDRLYKLYKKLGRTPKQVEITFYDTLIGVYGTMEEACKRINIPYRKPGSTFTREKYTKVFCINFLSDYFKIHNSFPTHKWYREQKKVSIYIAIKRHGEKFIYKEVLKSDGIFKKSAVRVRYNKEELIEFLRNFQTLNNRLPSTSDCKRHLLPHASRYIYVFGSWGNAMKEAFGI